MLKMLLIFGFFSNKMLALATVPNGTFILCFHTKQCNQKNANSLLQAPLNPVHLGLV